MKLFCILLVFFFFDVDAQRRSQTRHEVTSNEQPIRSRGRSRFSNPEYIQLAEETNRRPSSRRRPDPTIAPIEKQNFPSPITPSSTVSYAVEEIVDETDPLAKPRVITESNFEIPNIPQKTQETEDSLKDISSEINSPSNEEVLPNIQVENNGASSSQEKLDANLSRLNEKVVPITRNNARNGVNRAGNERKTEPRNGSSRNGNSRGSRNGSSRVPVENDVPPARNGLSRAPNSEDSISKLDLLTETNPLSPSSKESSRDENEIRKEIVRNSVPKLPQPIGIPTELNKPILPKKTIKKTLRTRPNTNTRTEETVATGSVRSRSNTRVVENYEPPSRSVPSARTEQASPVLRATVSPRVIEEYIPPSRGRTAGAPRELEYTPSQRTRASITPRTEEPVVTARSRSRGSRRPVESTPTIPSRSSQRVNRRRPESATTGIPISRRGPSVFSSTEESHPTRSRTGRKITQDDGRRSRSDAKSENKNRNVEAQSSDQVSSVARKGSRFRKDETLDSSSTSRNRFNGRPPLNIDESKLEVLPLFEGETKIVSQPGSRSNQLQVLGSSATETENNVLSPPNDATATISTRSDISHTKKEISDAHFKRKPYRKTEIKESVIISQVTEVTSKKTITRKPVSKPGSRKFADIKSQASKAKLKNGITSSEEDISESDNYPESFKALIQSKKHAKESRSSESSTISKKAEEIVSSSASPRLALVTPTVPSRASTASNKYGNIFENEVKPNTLTPPTLPVTRKRFTTSKSLEHLKSKKATTPIRNKVSRSTLAPPKEPKDHRFHSKFNAVTKNENVVISKPFKSTSAKGLPNRKSKLSDKNASNKTRNSLELGNSRSQFTAPPISKTSRYSSRYRSNAQSRSARTSTPAPAYIPTIPNVKPYSPPVKSQEDPELGLEYITFDAPVRSLSSANLINEEFRPSSDANSNSLDSKQEKGVKTTEKPTSIIERIINSITGINLTTDPTAISPTTTANIEPTKSSAILSLAPKKVAKNSQSKDNLTQHKTKSSKRDASTSEKPTTVIQRILNSLSAIQAATTTETTTTLTTDSSNFANKQQTTEVISLEQLLMQRNTIKSWGRVEENFISEFDNKVVDNTVNEIQETNTPPTKKMEAATPLSIVSNTGTPSFLNTILSTLQSIGTTRVPKIQTPTTLAPLRFSSTYRAPLVTTMFGSTTSVPTTTFKSTATTTSATETMTTSASKTTTSIAAKLTTTSKKTTTLTSSTAATTTSSTTTTPATTTTPITTTVPTTTASTSAPSTTTPITTITVPPPITTTISPDEKDTPTQTLFTSKPFQTSRAGKAITQSTVFPYFNPSEFPLLSIFSTERPRRTNEDRAKDSMKYSTNTPTTVSLLTKITTAKNVVTTEDLEELLKKPIDSIKPKKRLTEQQKKDLETVRQLEREQAAILKQLSFLTNLNLNANSFNNAKSSDAKSSDNLANRIIALAKERDGQKVKATSTKPTTTTSRTTTTSAKPKTTMDYKNDAERERMKQIENLIRLLNMNGVTPSPNKESTYGTSNDAILAALLKDRGIGPSTPKQLAEQIEQLGFFTQTNEVTTKPTRKRKPTTQPTRGPIMQRLSWLLNALAPPPTKTPSRKPKATTRKPKPKKVEQDLTTEVTEMTPVVTSLPTKTSKVTVSQEDIQKLIKQLEAIQRDPSAARNLDLSSFRSLQNLNKDNVQVFMPGSSGISQREITKPITRAATQKPKTTSTIESVELEVPTVRSRASVRAVRTSTFSPTPVSNSVFDDIEEEVTPQRGKVTLPPVKLRPVSGVSDDAGSLVRGRLLSAAVNVTRAISGFLGSALQEAVGSLSRGLSSGSFRNFLGGSSTYPNTPSPSAVKTDIKLDDY